MPTHCPILFEKVTVSTCQDLDSNGIEVETDIAAAHTPFIELTMEGVLKPSWGFYKKWEVPGVILWFFEWCQDYENW